jgi:cell division septation protein DedD
MISKPRVPVFGTPVCRRRMNLLRKHLGVVTILAAIFGFRAVAFAQTSIVVEVQVLELSRADMETMGGTVAMPAFAKTVGKSLADSLTSGPRSRVVHRIELPATTNNATQVRLDSRIAVTSTSSADVSTVFDAGIAMDVIPKVYQDRDISLATGSQVRIRRGLDVNGTSLVIFENPVARFDTRIHEGESIVLGGFITAAERMTLPDMPALPDNPILNYLYPKVRNPQDRPEIAILLTPRIVGPLVNPAVDAPVFVSKPATVNPIAPSLALPAASSLAAATSPGGITQSAISSALPVSSAPAPSNSSPVLTSPQTIAAIPPASSIMTVPVSRSQPAAPPPVVADRPVAPIANHVEVEGTGGKYTVQVGAFDQLEKAESLRSQLAKNYDMVFVEKVGTSKTPYRVRVGRFPDMQSARKVEMRLASDGFETYVTMLN